MLTRWSLVTAPDQIQLHDQRESYPDYFFQFSFHSRGCRFGGAAWRGRQVCGGNWEGKEETRIWERRTTERIRGKLDAESENKPPLLLDKTNCHCRNKCSKKLWTSVTTVESKFCIRFFPKATVGFLCFKQIFCFVYINFMILNGQFVPTLDDFGSLPSLPF